MISDEKIKRVAEEFIPHRMTAHGLILADATPDELLLFARAIYEQGRADQRESDARLCESKLGGFNWGSENADIYHAQDHRTKQCAEAIRNNTGDITKCPT